MAEVARRSLVASLDGGPFDREGDRYRVVVAQDHEELRLELSFDAAEVVVRLELAATEHRWRSGWLLEIARGNDRWVLSAEAREVTIADARREPVIVRPRLQQRALQRELAGAIEQVRLADVAGHKYTRQSTATPVESAVPWAAPTVAEREPWWELDLAKSMYVAWLRVDLGWSGTRPRGARVVIRAYAFVMPDGSPPRDSIVFEAPLDQLAVHDERIAIAAGVDVVARLVRVELISPEPCVLAVTAAEVLAAELIAGSLETLLRRSFALFRDRALFVAVDGTPRASYGEIWSRATAFARGLAKRVEPIADDEHAPPKLRGRGVLALLLRSRPEWLVADLAGLMRGYVSVPISPDESDDRLAFILARAPATIIVCEAADAARLARIAPRAQVVACDDPSGFDAVLAEGTGTGDVPPPPPRDPDDLYAVLFTSGSTGSPKGAMRTYATFFSMVSSYQIGHSPRHLSFQPLSHLSERMYLPSLLLHGGTIAFSRGGGHLLDELRTFEPTTIGSVPRLFEVLHAGYRRRLRALLAADRQASRGELERRALSEARGSFGNRLAAISIGSAPVSPEVFGFLKRCFADLWVSEGYGSTEDGTIATDGKIAEHAEVKLVPLVDSPDPDRGEIWVKSPHAIAGYLGDEDATSAAFDADGYFATGDLGQRDAAGRIRVVGRLRNTVKLAQGEFVSAERIETALAACPLVDRIYVHAISGAAGVAAVVVPHADVLARGLEPDDARAPELANPAAHPAAIAHVLSALRATARTAGLAAYETPRGVIVEGAPFTVESGLITANGKLARTAIAARYGAQLSALASGAVEPTDLAGEPADDDDTADLRARVVRVATQAIGRALTIDEPLASAGVDSLASAEILAALSDELGRDVPLTWWFEARTLADLATRLGHFAEISGPARLREVATADLARPPIVIEPGPGGSRRGGSDRGLLVTGATGFLGAHLVSALIERGFAVTCLVRAPDDAAAMSKLRGALASRELAIPDGAALRAIAGDLAAPAAGLAGRETELDRIEAIVHAGATVSWLASYESLRASNVLGTYALLELAAKRGWRFHHVSTISTAPRDGDEASELTFDAALASTPYGLSKWIAEQHVKRAGLAKTIYRPAMIAGHTRTGVSNADDFTCRYLVGCIELGMYVDRDDAIMDMTPVDHVATSIAVLLDRPPAGELFHLANIEGSMSFGAVGRALAASGRNLRPASYAEFREALQRSKTSRLHALGAFFPATFALGMGPFPSAKTSAVLAAYGVRPPKIDEAMIARYVGALARHGHVR